MSAVIMSDICDDICGLTSMPLNEIEAARDRIQKHVLRTPLVRLHHDGRGAEIYLKLENLQPTGSFKVRGAANVLLYHKAERLADGVWCPSAGNFGQGIAYMARNLGIHSTIIAPETAPSTKLKSMKQLGGEVITVTGDEWWQAVTSHHFEGMSGLFLHPVSNRHVIAGNGTIGLEILEDLPDVDVIMTPYGGGGLTTGIASAVKAMRPQVQIIACEVATAAPLTHARRVGEVSPVPDHKPSFVDGANGKSVLAEMWQLAQNVIDDTALLTLEQIAEAIRILLNQNRILAEGAGALSVAAALASSKYDDKKVVAVVSGGNLDMDHLKQILNGNVPKI